MKKIIYVLIMLFVIVASTSLVSATSPATEWQNISSTMSTDNSSFVYLCDFKNQVSNGICGADQYILRGTWTVETVDNQNVLKSVGKTSVPEDNALIYQAFFPTSPENLVCMWSGYVASGIGNEMGMILTDNTDTRKAAITNDNEKIEYNSNQDTGLDQKTGDYWQFKIVTNKTGNKWKFYVNDTYHDEYVTSTGSMTNITKWWMYGMHNTAVNYWGYIACWDYDVYGLAGPQQADTTAPTQTIVYPINKYYNDYDNWINITTDENANCTINDTIWELNTSLTTATSIFFRSSSALSDGEYDINVSCWDALNNNGTTTVEFGIDLTLPAIISNIQSNNTIWYNNFTFQFNLTDDRKIFSINVSAVDFNNYTDNINDTTYSYNGSFLLENYTTGKHYINATVCDAHTKKLIEDWKINKDSTTKKITFNDKLSIRPKYPNHFESFDTIKDKDRYKIDYIKKNEHKDKAEPYIVEGENLHIIGDEMYTGWLVDSELKKWIDFENEEGYKATIKRISKTEIEVTTKGEHFKSVGELNCNNYTYEFYKFNYSIEYTKNTIETSNNLMKLVINVTSIPINNKFINNIYNGTTYSTVIVNSSTQINATYSRTNYFVNQINTSYEFYYNFTINGYPFNTTTQTQYIYKMSLISCGGITNATTINFTSYDEITNNNVNTSMLAYFEVWKDNISQYRNYSFNFSDSKFHEICIYPSFETYSVDFITQFENLDYSLRNYIKRNYSLSNSTINFPIYMLSSSNTTTVTVNLIDDVDNKYPNLLIEMYYFDLGNASYKLVESKISNSEGKGAFSVNYNKHFYLFRIFEGRAPTLVEEDDDHFQINDLNLYYTIYSGSSTSLEDWIVFRDIQSGWNYDNSTRNLTLSWGLLPSSLNNIVVDIKHTNGTTIYTSSSSTPSSSISYAFPSTFNDTYVAMAYYVSNDGLNYPAVDPYSGDLRTNQFTEDKAVSLGLAFLVMLVVGTLSFINPVAGIIGTVVSIFVISIFGLIPLLETEIISIVLVGILIIILLIRRITR